MYILAVDPGKHVGFASIKPYNECMRSVHAWQHEGGVYLIAEAQLDNKFDEYDTIVCEDYIIRPQTVSANVGSKLETVRMIGALETIAHLNCQEFVLQPPSIKTAWPKNRLYAFAEKYELHRSLLSTSHKRDALRHLLYYIEKNFEPIITNPTVF